MITRAAVICAMILVLVTNVSAQGGGDRAVALGREAMELYNAQKWVQAHDRFAQAERAHHSPVFVLYMARCKLELKDLLAARELFQRVASETIDPGAPPSWHRAREDAVAELGLLGPRLASVRLRVTRAHGEEVTVHIDGQLVTDLGGSIELNPGEHRIEARAGERSARSAFDLGEGERDRLVSIELPPAPAAPKQPDTGPSGYTIASAVLLGLAGAALIVGAVTGGLAIGATNDIKDNCIENSCLKSDEEAGDRANVLATVSTVSFIAAGAAAAGGVAFILVPMFRGDDDAYGLLLSVLGTF